MRSVRPIFLLRMMFRILSVGLVLLTLIFPDHTRAADLVTYVAQTGAPVMIKNFVNPTAGCSWTGVGGHVFSRFGAPLNGLVIRVTGTMDGRSINQTATTGGSAQFGPGGYHLQLGNRPPASASLLLRVENNAGQTLSFHVPVPLVNNCNRNLTVINLVQRTFTNLRYLPLIRK